MFLERGIDVSYETIRRWVAKFGPASARELRRRQYQPGDIWHLDEVVVTIKGRKFWLWRAVDQNGVALDEILQGYRSPRGLQRFVSIHSTIRNCFSVPARRRSALTIRYHRLEAFDAWNAVVSVG